MFTYYVIFKGDNKDLAHEELRTLWDIYHREKIKIVEVENILFKFESSMQELNQTLLKRLTYTNYIGLKQFPFHNRNSFLQELKEQVKSSWSEKEFAVRIRKSKRNHSSIMHEKEYAEAIWDCFQDPSVNLESPQIEYTLIESSQESALCISHYHNEKEYLRRMPKRRPVQMPYTLKSDMARACVNLLGLKEGIILDPFCGVGGILLEAYDMGFNIVGNDISWNDLKYFKENMNYFFKDHTAIRVLSDMKTNSFRPNSIDGIVTDVPYGKASRKLGTELYASFLKHSQQALKPYGKLVVIYAHFVEFEELASQYFTITHKIEEYINRSMTRYILVLENNKPLKRE